MGGCLRLAYEVLNWIAVNQTMWSQTKAHISKSLCVDKRGHSMTYVNRLTLLVLGCFHYLIF